MNHRLHIALLLAAFLGICWLQLPDAMSPLVLAIPYFAFSVFSRGRVQAVDFAVVIGLLAIVASIGALILTEREKLFLVARIALVISATLFVLVSQPLSGAAISAVPFAILAIWPARKTKPNQIITTKRPSL